MELSENLQNLPLIAFGFTLVFGFFIGIIASWRRAKDEKLHAYDLTFLQIKMPKDNEREIEVAVDMFSNLSSVRKPFLKALFSGRYRISFEIVSKTEGIGFYVVVPDDIASLVEKMINGAYPEAEIDIVNPEEVWDRGTYTRVSEMKLRNKAYTPIKVYEDLKTDSLNSITSGMSKVGEQEVLAIQYVVQPSSGGWRREGRKFVTHVRNKAANPEKSYNIDNNYLEGIEKKVAYPGFDVAIRLVSISDKPHSADAHIQNMKASFEHFNDVNFNGFTPKAGLITGIFNKRVIDDFIYRRIKTKEFTLPILEIGLYRNYPVLNTMELATVFHLPSKEVLTPNIIWLTSRKASAPMHLPEEKDGIWLGESSFRGVKKQIYMKEKDRTRHFYIIGQTGTGKSELLKYMALQDIRNGEGVAVIDPHGTDVQDLLAKMPPERADDVIYFNAADLERPIGLNMLEHSSEEQQHMIINSFIALLYKLYDPNRQGIMGPQLERAIRNVMLTAMVDKDSTMVDVLRLLIDEKYSKKFIEKITDPLVKKYWTDEVANTSAQRKGETMGYFVSKFDKFVTDKLMRNILGQPKSAINIPHIMANRKILLVDLAKGKIGEENSDFLGLLLVPRLLNAALERQKMIEQGMDFPSFYLYVDEFQNFATDAFETILSEARKYKLNLTVAHQFVSQLPEEIKEAIFGNVGSMCTFRVGTDDAEFLEAYFSPTFTQQDISNLPVGNAYVKLLVDGHPTPPFSMNVPWDVIHTNVPKSPELAKQIKELSRTKYGKDSKEVEEYINMRSGLYDKPEEEEEPPRRPRIPF